MKVENYYDVLSDSYREEQCEEYENYNEVNNMLIHDLVIEKYCIEETG